MALNPIDLDQLEASVQRQPVTLRLLVMGLQALSSRALVWVAALGGAALWSFAVVDPTWLRLAAATGYCVSVLFPVLWRDRHSERT